MKRVLVIDDCEEFREVVGELLVEAGFQVLIADGPEQASQHIKNKSFDLVICDLCMPIDTDYAEDYDSGSVMVGVHTVNEISKSLPKVPIIAVSGQLTGEPLKAIQQFGAVTTLSKPFGQAELLQAVETAFASRS